MHFEHSVAFNAIFLYFCKRALSLGDRELKHPTLHSLGDQGVTDVVTAIESQTVVTRGLFSCL